MESIYKVSIMSYVRFRLIAFLLITSLAIILYSNTLDNEFTYWDDNYYVTDNETIRELGFREVLKLLDPSLYFSDVDGLYRLPPANISYAVDYYFWRLNPTGYHITNIFLYILVSILLYLFFEKITAIKSLALIGTIVFIAHPVHVESVTWISTRKDLFSLIFLLLSFLPYIRYNSDLNRNWAYYIGSVLMFSLALLSKPILVYGPLLLIIYDLCFKQKRIKGILLDKVPFILLSAAISIIIRNNFAVINEDYLTAHIGFYRLVLMIFKILCEYIFMLFLPVNLNAYYAYNNSDLPMSVLEVQSLLSILFIILVMIVSIVAYLRNKRIITFCIIWFFISLIPVLNIVPISTIKADRYLFVPSIGFSLLFAYIVYNLFNLNKSWLLKRTVSVIFMIILVFFSVLTIERNNVWQNGVTLWQDSSKKSPDSPSSYFMLGNEYRHRGMIDMAIERYEEALRLEPAHIKACSNLGAAYGMSGKYKNALSVLKRCIEIDPFSTDARINLVQTYLSIGKKQLAFEEVREILRIDPKNRKALRMLRM